VADIRDEIPASHRDLIDSPLTVVVTTVDPSSRPQSTAVWYLVDDDGQLKGSITSDRQKYKNLVGNPNCCKPLRSARYTNHRRSGELPPHGSSGGFGD
jgi:hypothetical protein